MKKSFIAVFAIITLAIPAVLEAQTNTSTSTIAQLQAQIQSLLQQIQTLQKQIGQAQQEMREVSQELRTTVRELRSQLHQGIKDEEVTLLQELLATDIEIYPEGLVTGYFGPLTKQAVIRFQLKHGIEGVGEVGPQTRRALNAFIKKGIRGNKIIDNHLLSKFDTDEVETGDANTGARDRAERGRGRTKVRICHKPADKTLVIAAPALNAHLAHGDSLGTCSGNSGNGDKDDNNDT